MDKKLIRDIAALKKQAKENGSSVVKIKVAHTSTSSLHEVIKTRAQADTFMTILKSL